MSVVEEDVDDVEKEKRFRDQIRVDRVKFSRRTCTIKKPTPVTQRHWVTRDLSMHEITSCRKGGIRYGGIMRCCLVSMRYCVYDLVKMCFLKVLAVRLVLLDAGLPALVALGLFAEHLDL